ncbi:MAG: hypothetical protein IPO24_18585 [Bacteroidetes bacterium]|nr:hypothetical protein [Bacteroidota bacterium]
MKVKLLMLSISLITCISVFGQGQQAGTLSFQAGYDFGVHGTLYKSQYLGLVLALNIIYLTGYRVVLLLFTAPI